MCSFWNGFWKVPEHLTVAFEVVFLGSPVGDFQNAEQGIVEEL